jgi:hypothetical protein
LSGIPQLKSFFNENIASGGSLFFPWLSSVHLFEFTQKADLTIIFSLGNLLDIIIFCNIGSYIEIFIYHFIVKRFLSGEHNTFLLCYNLFCYYNDKENSEVEKATLPDEPYANNFEFPHLFNNIPYSIYGNKKINFNNLPKSGNWSTDRFSNNSLSSLSKINNFYYFIRSFDFFDDFLWIDNVFLLSLWCKSAFFSINNISFSLYNEMRYSGRILPFFTVLFQIFSLKIILIFIISLFLKFKILLFSKHKTYYFHVHTIISNFRDFNSKIGNSSFSLCEILLYLNPDLSVFILKRIQTIYPNNHIKKKITE